MSDTDFFAFTTEPSIFRSVCILLSSAYFIASPIFLTVVIKYEKNIHRRTILNYFACDFCYLLIIAFLIVQTLETGRFIVGPNTHFFCYLLITSRGILLYSLILTINFQTIMKYVLIFIWKSPFGFQDDFWYFFIKIFIIVSVFIIQFVAEFFRRFQTFEFHFCIGSEPTTGNGPNYVPFMMVILTVGIQFGLFLRMFFFRKSRASRIVDTSRLSEMETESVLNFFSTISAAAVIGLASVVFFILSKVKPENLGKPPFVYLLYWRIFLYPVFSCTLIFFIISKNKRFRSYVKRNFEMFSLSHNFQLFKK